MTTQSFEFFLHGKGQPQVHSALPTETLRAVLQREDALPDALQFVFIGEVDGDRGEGEEDDHEPANLDLTLEQLGFKKHTHVHTRAPKRVAVTVYFNGQKSHRFSPVTTIATVTAWAKKKFHVDPASGDDLVLAIKPGGTHPRPDQHLGELLEHGAHSLEFDLVREVTPQGC